MLLRSHPPPKQEKCVYVGGSVPLKLLQRSLVHLMPYQNARKTILSDEEKWGSFVHVTAAERKQEWLHAISPRNEGKTFENRVPGSRFLDSEQ